MRSVVFCDREVRGVLLLVGQDKNQGIYLSKGFETVPIVTLRRAISDRADTV